MLPAGQTGPLPIPEHLGSAVTPPRPGLLQEPDCGFGLALGTTAQGGSCLWRQFPGLLMRAGLKRAEQAQSSSSARSSCCYSRERRGRGPGGPKSRALRSLRCHSCGTREREGMGEGLAAEALLREAAALGPPAPRIRWAAPSAPPARPRRSDHGLFLWGAGLESGPRRLRGRPGNSAHRSGSDRRTLAPERKPRTRPP